MMFLASLKKWLKTTPLWRFVRFFAKGIVQTMPLAFCRFLVYLPWIGLIASARLLANERCEDWFTGVPGKQVELVPGLNARTPKSLKKAKSLLICEPSETFSIREHCHIIKGQENNFSNKKVALVAHWDPENRVDQFVEYYLRSLQEAGFVTVLASAVPIASSEEGLVCADAAVYRTCAGYDFTSWKGALESFSSLLQAEEILFTNDSVFAPLSDIGTVHTVMDAVDCDFWGLMESRDQVPAMPSFYMVFRKKALLDPSFEQFWKNVDMTSDKEEVVQRFEQSQALWFALNGLVPGAYIHWDMVSNMKGGPAYVCWKQLVQLFGVPCIKRAVVNGDIWWADITGWENLVAQSGYPVELIHNFLGRYNRTRK